MESELDVKMKKMGCAVMLTVLLVLSLTGCYSREDVDTVMQELIKAAGADTTESVSESETEEILTEEQVIHEEQTTEEIKVPDYEWKTAYQTLVNDYITNDEWAFAFSILVDMEKDGVPELIVRNFDGGYIYTYENGQVVNLGFEVYAMQRYYYKDNMLVACGYGMWAGDGVIVSFLKKEGTQLLAEEYKFYGTPGEEIVVEYTDTDGTVTWLNYDTAKAAVEAEGVQVTYTSDEYEVDFLATPLEPYTELEWYDWTEGNEGITGWN